MNTRKIFKRASLIASAAALTAAVYRLKCSIQYQPELTSFTSNPNLSYVPGAEDYKGNPLDQRGLFMNEEKIFWPRMRDVLKWKTSVNPYKEEKINDTRRLEVNPLKSLDELPDNSITWLGHATFIFQLEGIRILFDPILSGLGMFKRYSDLPVERSEFKNIDYILISHNHRDHCDKDSIRFFALHNPETTWLCGLGLDALLLKEWTGSKKIQAAGWYQQFEMKDAQLQISYLPSRHWSRRGLLDTNASLWGAYMFEVAGKKIYFGGDSGYSGHLKKTFELFGKVDYYIAGIGAFSPRWFMSPSHMHPEEVAQASNELQAKNLLPMHYGTFDLSDEPLLEPARLIKYLKFKEAFEANLIMPVPGVPVLI